MSRREQPKSTRKRKTENSVIASHIKSITEAYATFKEMRGSELKLPKGFKYSSIYEFIGKNGQAFKPRKLPTGVERGMPKECYKNALLLAVARSSELIYVEGLALGLIPVQHAWCVDYDGFVVDPTWCGGKNPKLGTEYFGVKINTQYAQDAVIKNRMFGVIEDWRGGFPLLKQSKRTLVEKGILLK